MPGAQDQERGRPRHAEAVDAGLEALGDPNAAPVRQLRELLDAGVGRRRLRARAQRKREAQRSAAPHGVAPGRSTDRLAVRRGGLQQQSAFTAFAQRRNRDSQRVAGFHDRRAPAQVVEIDRRAHFEAPFLVLSLVVLHDELDVAVRVGPLELAHGAGERHRLRLVEHHRGVMRQRRVGAERDGNRPKSTNAAPHEQHPVFLCRSVAGDLIARFPRRQEKVDRRCRRSTRAARKSFVTA